MSVRVRFAPSPTGYLHIGGARTALYNYLFAKSQGGKFILRIEDTDLERSKKEYEEAMISELKWLGIDYDEGPDKVGAFGPYRQSERLDLYLKYANQLIDSGDAYYCFCSDEELAQKKEELVAKNLAPHYDGKCKSLDIGDAKKRVANGEKAAIRFKVCQKEYSFEDIVRNHVSFPPGMVGDFVLIRSNGLPVYNYCCVIDDWLMKISHVIRAEEHLANTLRQLMLYEALKADIPKFAHVSLLVNKDRQKLSKRDGATSVIQYREMNFMPEALCNYLCLLGWSHPQEKDIFTMKEVSEIFNLERFIKSAALFDLEKLNWVNGQHLRSMSNEDILKDLNEFSLKDSLFFAQDTKWQLAFINLYKNHVEFTKDILNHVENVFSSSLELTDDLKEIFSWETTPLIRKYLLEEIETLKNSGVQFMSEGDFDRFSQHIKNTLKIKGKFLFMGMRGVLTGKAHGPDLKYLLPLTPLAVIQERLITKV